MWKYFFANILSTFYHLKQHKFFYIYSLQKIIKLNLIFLIFFFIILTTFWHLLWNWINSFTPYVANLQRTIPSIQSSTWFSFTFNGNKHWRYFFYVFENKFKFERIYFTDMCKYTIKKWWLYKFACQKCTLVIFKPSTASVTASQLNFFNELNFFSDPTWVKLGDFSHCSCAVEWCCCGAKNNTCTQTHKM